MKGRPEPRAREGAGAHRVLELPVEADLAAFDGHFEGNPILPGVVQVDWAIRYAEEAFGPLGTFAALEQLKFTGLSRPGTSLRLVLDWNAEARTLHFAFEGEGERKSSGRVRFR